MTMLKLNKKNNYTIELALILFLLFVIKNFDKSEGIFDLFNTISLIIMIVSFILNIYFVLDLIKKKVFLGRNTNLLYLFFYALILLFQFTKNLPLNINILVLTILALKIVLFLYVIVKNGKDGNVPN